MEKKDVLAVLLTGFGKIPFFIGFYFLKFAKRWLEIPLIVLVWFALWQVFNWQGPTFKKQIFLAFDLVSLDELEVRMQLIFSSANGVSTKAFRQTLKDEKAFSLHNVELTFVRYDMKL